MLVNKPSVGSISANYKTCRLELSQMGNRLVKQFFSPRYIHSYTNPEAVPYRVDASVLPSNGSFGIVRKVVHRHFNQELAQKTFANVFSEKDRKKIQREIGVLEVCHHRNIVSIVEAYEIQDEPHSIHLVMTPWAPYTLLQFLRRPDIKRRVDCPWFTPHLAESDKCIYRVMRGIADAVAFLHGLSIKHKDIKPDNILLHQEGTREITPIVTDVGLSKFYKHGANTDYIKSSYQYLAPEQLRQEDSSFKADIWQLGCCFAMLLALASGGTTAVNQLWTSFEWTDENCSCNIASEHSRFMKAFEEICLPGTIPQERAYALVTRMLDPNHLARLSIEKVQMELADLS